MLKSMLSGACLSAIAGAAMLTVSAAPASAFTLASPSLAPSLAAMQVDHVWYDRWGRWHPNRRYGYGYGYGYHHRHCWRGRYGRLHCG